MRGGSKMKKLKVLIAEDDRIIRELYNSFLAEEIFERYFVENGKEALDAYRTWQPEVIILDLMLPVVSGFNVLKEIREHLGDKKTPILIASSLSKKDDILSCAKLGVQGYLAKPINWKEIGLKVMDCFQKEYPHTVDRVAQLRKQLDAKAASDAKGEGKEKGTGDRKETGKMEKERAEFEAKGLPDDSNPGITEEASPPVFGTAEEVTRRRFSQADLRHPFLAELFQICILRQTQDPTLQKASENSQNATKLERPPGVSTKSPSSLREKDLADVLDRIVGLVSLPRIVFEIDRVINDPQSSATNVADIVSKDPNLTAKLLKMVNSAFYNFSLRIDTISRAVTILGSEELRTLALATSALEMFKGIPSDLVDMKSFWEHSIACGAAARTIASHMNIMNIERLFVAGLLHDIGRIVIYKYLPDQGREVLLYAQQTGCLLRSAELEVLGFDHTQIGSMLVKRWQFPLVLEQALACHHQPALSQSLLEASIVHVADILANALMIGTSGERFVPPLNPEAWAALKLTTNIFRNSGQLIDQQVAETIHMFFGETDKI
jgi:putative nucleotidyltransferase with HDIG domain